jgi:hypothetical protein
MGIAIKGLNNIQKSIDKIDAYKDEFGKEFLARVKEKTPVDTGRLQAAWELKVNKDTITVKNPALNDEGEPYAIYVEFGTDKMRGVFMLQRTIAESGDISKVAKMNAGIP